MTDARQYDGFVLVVDVCGYSRLPQELQQGVVRFLSDTALELDLLRQLPRQDYAINCTGDGFLLVVRDGLARLGESLLDAGTILIEACKAYRPPADVSPPDPAWHLQIKAALHRGEFYFGLPLFGLEGQAIGKGLNMATRLCDLAAPSQFLVDEAVVRRIAGNRGAAMAADFSPPLPGAAVRFAVKHREYVEFRSLARPGLNTAASPRVRQLEVTGEALYHALQDIAAYAASFVGEQQEERPDVRVSWWLPDHQRGEMICSDFRATASGPAGTTSSTTYRLEPPEGPVALAAVKRAVQVTPRLPESGGPAYERAWSRLGVPVEKVRRFGRRPRHVLAVPMVWDRELIGVLCIDIVRPALVPKRDLVDLGTVVDRFEARLVTALAALRGGP